MKRSADAMSAFRLSLSCSLCLFMLACDSGGSSNAAHDAGGGGASDAAPPGGDSGSASSSPTWTRVYNEVIAANACNSLFCHAGALAGSLNLSPTQDDAYTALFNTAAAGDKCKGKTTMKRVTPGKPDQSLLYNKLSGKPPVCGLGMPPKPYTPATQAQINLVRDWIAAGAKND